MDRAGCESGGEVGLVGIPARKTTILPLRVAGAVAGGGCPGA
ncbi:MAG: hypothetical protein ACYS76_06575 [Planctomycetota bacterium]